MYQLNLSAEIDYGSVIGIYHDSNGMNEYVSFHCKTVKQAYAIMLLINNPELAELIVPKDNNPISNEPDNGNRFY